MLQSNYTREHSEATQALLRGFVGDIVEGVASSRGLPEAEVHPLPDPPAAMQSNNVPRLTMAGQPDVNGHSTPCMASLHEGFWSTRCRVSYKGTVTFH